MHLLYNKIFENNKEWVAKKLKSDPDYFNKLNETQTPPILWIGCSDSRVPANEITGTNPGEIFVHRNIANMVVHTDMNMLSVLDYAVNVLKVTHIIVCGHYNCGGVKAAMGNDSIGIIDNWLRNIKEVYKIHYDELKLINDQHERMNKLVEFNIIEQVKNLAKTSIVQKAWKSNQELKLHGIVYDLKNGYLKDLNSIINEKEDIDKIYHII